MPLLIPHKNNTSSITAKEMIAKLEQSIQKRTGLSSDEIRETTLHEIEKRCNITITPPKREFQEKLGYHRNPHYHFTSPNDRRKTIKRFDDDFGIEQNEFVDEYMEE